MKKILPALLIFFLSVSISAAAEEIVVAAAANIAPAAEELKHIFEAEHPGVTITVISGSSGKLSTQIKNGAPFDIFLSADMEYARGLADAGLTTGPVKPYAMGTLILFIKNPAAAPADITVLENNSISTIALAKPALAPYGRAAIEAMTRAGVMDAVKEKLVFAENVTQAAQFAITAADSGLLNKSVLFTAAYAPYRAKEGINWIEIPGDLYTPIKQGAVLLKAGKKQNAAAFYQFIFSPSAGDIFSKRGYLPPS